MIGTKMKKLLFALLFVTSTLFGQNAMFFGTTGLADSEIGNWTIQYASYDTSEDINSQEPVIQGVFVGNEGTKMYIIGHTNDQISEYTLTTAYDVSTSSYVGSMSVSALTNYPQDICFDKTGAHMYFIDASNARVYQYDLSTPWSISTATQDGYLAVGGICPSPDGLFISTDGSKMIMISDSNDEFSTINLSTAYDITTGTQASKDLSISAKDDYPGAVSCSNDGTKYWFIGRGGDKVYEYTLTTPWDCTTGSFTREFSVSGQDGSGMGLSFSRDGEYMYIAGNTNNKVFSYTLSPSN